MPSCTWLLSRILTLLVAALTCATVTACDDDDDDTPDAGAPRIVIVGPATGSVLATLAPTLSFEVEDVPAAGYAVRIGDAAPVDVLAPIALGERVDVTLELLPGVNTVTLSVWSSDDATDEATVVLVVETDAPIVELAAPAAGASTFLGSVDVRGRILSGRTISTATVRAGGTPSALTLTPTPGGYAFAGTVALAVGANTVEVSAIDDRNGQGTATANIVRNADVEGPVATVEFPRDGQAVRTREVLLRGAVTDASTTASVTVATGAQTVTATLASDGTYVARIALAPANNDVTVTATDGFGNTRALTTRVYYGQRLASGGGHGGAIRGGRLHAWGRNNLGQTGLGFVSHENRTAYCDRALTDARAAAWCKATTISAIDAICLNPGFVTPTPSDSPAAMACRATARARRDAVCDAAGASAPSNCKTSTSANLANVCDAAYGAGTPASGACEAGLVCDAAYEVGSPDHASCTATASVVPSVFPTPATPYAPVALDSFSTTAAPGAGVPFASLGVTFTSVSFNQNASSAIDSAGRVWSWGDGSNGMSCLGDTSDRAFPHRVDEFGASGTTAVALSRGYDHVLILRSDGSVWGCGLNGVGQIGDGTSGAAASRAVPTQVQGLPANIVQVLASAQSSYALTADGVVYAWGRNQYGNLGNGTSSTASAAAPTPAIVPGLTDVVMIASGRDHVLAATSAGAVYAWGLNASNQVNSSEGNVLSPVAITGITGARAVYANGNQGFYEDRMGQLLGWGQNGSGNLGIPTDEDQPAPTMPVFGITGVLDVAIGALQGFAQRGDQVFGWGWSFHGSLGAGTSAIHTWPYRTPLPVQLP